MNEHIKSEISVYLAGGLPEARNRQIEAHLASCEKCAQAVAKARTKQARVKREALKKASSDPLPNLFLARQGKDIGVDRPVSKGPWIVALVILLGAAGYWAYRYTNSGSPVAEKPAMKQDAPPIEVSSAPAISSSAAVSPAAPTPEPTKPPTVLKVRQEWHGADGGIKNTRLVVIRSKEAWEQLWAETQNPDPVPSVNFGRDIVLGVFAGPRLQGVSVSVGRIHEADDEVVVAYRVSGPEIQVSSAAIPAPAHPYLLATIPRVDKKIRMSQWEVFE